MTTPGHTMHDVVQRMRSATAPDPLLARGHRPQGQRILDWLAEHPEGGTYRAIASAVGLTPSGAMTLLSRLHRHRLVTHDVHRSLWYPAPSPDAAEARPTSATRKGQISDFLVGHPEGADADLIAAALDTTRQNITQYLRIMARTDRVHQRFAGAAEPWFLGPPPLLPAPIEPSLLRLEEREAQRAKADTVLAKAALRRSVRELGLAEEWLRAMRTSQAGARLPAAFWQRISSGFMEFALAAEELSRQP